MVGIYLQSCYYNKSDVLKLNQFCTGEKLTEIANVEKCNDRHTVSR